MIFGYEPIDILLFDWQTLQLLYQSFIDKFFWVITGYSVILFLALVKPNSGTKSILMLSSLSWVGAGYFWLIFMSEVYWPATYFAYFLFFMGASINFYALSLSTRNLKTKTKTITIISCLVFSSIYCALFEASSLPGSSAASALGFSLPLLLSNKPKWIPLGISILAGLWLSLEFLMIIVLLQNT